MLDLDTFQKLIHSGTVLVRQGESQHAKFFTEHVEPVHQMFSKFCDKYLAIFRKLLAALSNPAISLDKTLDDLYHFKSLECSSCLIFGQLDEAQQSNTAHLGKFYAEYILSLRECLFQTQGTAQNTIVFNGTLQDELQRAVKRVRVFIYSESLPNEYQIRNSICGKLKNIINRFQGFRTKAEIAYLRLKEHCLASDRNMLV